MKCHYWLDEPNAYVRWRSLCRWSLRSLPFSEFVTTCGWKEFGMSSQRRMSLDRNWMCWIVWMCIYGV